jgi:hypothetical protein
MSSDADIANYLLTSIPPSSLATEPGLHFLASFTVICGPVTSVCQ